MFKHVFIVALAMTLGGCASVSPGLDQLASQVGLGKPAAPAGPPWKADKPSFGIMDRFVGKKYIAMDHTSTPVVTDGGHTLQMGQYQFRNTPDPRVLAVVARPPDCEEASASLTHDGKLVITCEEWDWISRSTYSLNEYGGYTELRENKNTAGLNFLNDFEYRDRLDYKPYSDATHRAEMLSKAYRDQQRQENARQEAENRREGARNFQNAMNNTMNDLRNHAAREAQNNATQAQMLNRINAQAAAQAQAQRQAQAETQRQAAEQRRQQLAENARWVANKEQEAVQYRQGKAKEQAQRAAELAARQQATLERQRQVKIEAEQKAAERQRQVEADAQERAADSKRRADAQRGALLIDQQRQAKAGEQNAPRQQPAKPTPAPVSKYSSSSGGKDLNCTTERQCRIDCGVGTTENILECKRSCIRRSACKVSLQ